MAASRMRHAMSRRVLEYQCRGSITEGRLWDNWQLSSLQTYEDIAHQSIGWWGICFARFKSLLAQTGWKHFGNGTVVSARLEDWVKFHLMVYSGK